MIGRHGIVVLAVLGLTVEACGDSKERAPVSQRALDSTIGASGLPGARGVSGALRASDSATARANRVDSVASDTTNP